MTNRASMSTEESQRVIDFLKTIPYDDAETGDNDEVSENAEHIAAMTFAPLLAYFSSSNQAFTCKFPNRLPIKPRGTPCKKRHKAFHEKFHYQQ
jgi:hypothetical protein